MAGTNRPRGTHYMDYVPEIEAAYSGRALYANPSGASLADKIPEVQRELGEGSKRDYANLHRQTSAYLRTPVGRAVSGGLVGLVGGGILGGPIGATVGVLTGAYITGTPGVRAGIEGIAGAGYEVIKDIAKGGYVVTKDIARHVSPAIGNAAGRVYNNLNRYVRGVLQRRYAAAPVPAPAAAPVPAPAPAAAPTINYQNLVEGWDGNGNSEVRGLVSGVASRLHGSDNDTNWYEAERRVAKFLDNEKIDDLGVLHNYIATAAFYKKDWPAGVNDVCTQILSIP